MKEVSKIDQLTIFHYLDGGVYDVKYIGMNILFDSFKISLTFTFLPKIQECHQNKIYKIAKVNLNYFS